MHVHVTNQLKWIMHLTKRIYLSGMENGLLLDLMPGLILDFFYSLHILSVQQHLFEILIVSLNFDGGSRFMQDCPRFQGLYPSVKDVSVSVF